MNRQYTRFLALTLFGSGLAPLVTYAASRMGLYTGGSIGDWFKVVHRWKLLAAVALIGAVTAVVWRLLLWLEPQLDANARQQYEFLANLPSRYIDLAIFGSAALSLFMELAIIRWQATVFEFFAFYKNFSLLACFAGLGLGYALAGRRQIPLLFTIPLLCWEFLLMIGIRYGLGENYQSLTVMPFPEQLNMGIFTAKKWF